MTNVFSSFQFCDFCPDDHPQGDLATFGYKPT
jgi:hypothetical protein